MDIKTFFALNESANLNEMAWKKKQDKDMFAWVLNKILEVHPEHRYTLGDRSPWPDTMTGEEQLAELWSWVPLAYKEGIQSSSSNVRALYGAMKWPFGLFPPGPQRKEAYEMRAYIAASGLATQEQMNELCLEEIQKKGGEEEAEDEKKAASKPSRELSMAAALSGAPLPPSPKMAATIKTGQKTAEQLADEYFNALPAEVQAAILKKARSKKK